MGGDPARVLLFGCSLDRNAIAYFCGQKMQSTEFLHGRWCYDTTLNVRIGSLFHPGVGYNGDLQKPFHKPFRKQSRQVTTRDMLEHYVNRTARDMLHGSPDLVVVDSSLWDLAAWRERVPCEGMARPCGTSACSQRCGESACTCSGREVSSERVERWCRHDLPGLLELVQGTFPTSRIAFRTAPTVIDGKVQGHEKFTSRDVEMLYDCVTSSTTEERLFGKYEVVDYHAIVKKLANDNVPGLFKYDGYHPSWYPSMLYINEVLRRVGASPRDPDAHDAHPDVASNARIAAHGHDDSATADDAFGDDNDDI